MLKTYKGSCHCGAVRLEADIDLRRPTYRCNCSVCSRDQFWPAVAKPEAFRLLAGQPELTKYLFNSMRNEHYFRKHCGVSSFDIGNVPGAGQVYGVDLGCLEEVTSEELAAAPIVYINGRHDNWQAAPAITSYF